MILLLLLPLLPPPLPVPALLLPRPIRLQSGQVSVAWIQVGKEERHQMRNLAVVVDTYPNVHSRALCRLQEIPEEEIADSRTATTGYIM